MKEEGILYASTNVNPQYRQNYSREIEIRYKLPDWDGCGCLTEIVPRMGRRWPVMKELD